MKPNTDLVTLLVLYIIDQDELYVDDHDGFVRLANWFFDDDRDEIYSFPSRLAPDICSECLTEESMQVTGGYVRDGCPSCRGLLPYNDKVIRIIWKQRFCEILRVNEAYFDYHLAFALEHIRNSREYKKQITHKEQPSKETL